MNQIIKFENIDFNQLVNGNNNKLSINFQSKMIDSLNKNFTDEEQKWYIANLYIYMHYHPTNDYPINLENVFKMIGFANKGNAMKTIKTNFTKDEDYKTSFLPKEKSSWGGSGSEQIMLNVDTFKNLCMLAKTEKGREIRKYYVKLENVYNHLVNEDRIEYENKTKQLENENKQLENALEQQQIKLEQTQKQLENSSKLKIKRWYDSEPGDTVYAVRIGKDNIIKIGKTKNIKKRESYYVNDQVGDVFHIRKCYNCDLAEKVLHHMLDKHRIESNKEWFEISENFATYIIDMTCNFLDKFISHSEKLVESGINENMLELINKFKIKQDVNEIKQEIKQVSSIVGEIKQIDEIKKEYIINNDIKHEIVVEDVDDILKLNKFIEQACEKDASYSSTSYELLGAYRIWNRGLVQTSRSHFVKYMKKHYKSSDKFFPEYNNSRISIYIGIRPKPQNIQMENANVLPRYEEFVLTNCKYDYTYRINYSDFIKEYEKWVFEKYSDYHFNKEEKIALEAYINRNFLKHKISMPDHKNVAGIWGIQLKSDNLIKVGINKTHTRKIFKIDINTDEIVDEYSSVVMAGNMLKIHRTNVRNFILSKKTIDNKYYLKYDKSKND